MADWQQIENVLDDVTEARTCAFCGGGIPRGDESRWGVAVRDTRDSVSVMWVHMPCFLSAVRPHLRGGFATMMGAAPYAERLVGLAAATEPGSAQQTRETPTVDR
jgi:hypothetical protein